MIIEMAELYQGTSSGMHDVSGTNAPVEMHERLYIIAEKFSMPVQRAILTSLCLK
jgi:hypothetical protein